MSTIHLSIWYSYALLAICFANLRGIFIVANEDRKAYIVYMGALPSKTEYSPSAHHTRILQEVVHSSYVGQSMIRTYSRSFNGFAANLTAEEAKNLSTHENVVSVFPSKTLQLHTTESWDFMGFPENVHRNLSFEGDVIIGMLDTGIWPESKSFSDRGFGPIPKKWKGVCKGGKNFTCNNKIIGARYYGDEISARDSNGHGSHTASIAAGNKVENASFYGIVNGTIRGGVPSARIAVYKTCCRDIDMLSAFDDAIADGVDIISTSLGTDQIYHLYEDAIAIGAFHAAEKGILTVHSAGNDGPHPGLISSVAPWLFTVAASSMNRKLITNVVFGNGTVLAGYSINYFELNGTQFPVVYGVDASTTCPGIEARYCDPYCLDKKLVTGKILLCQCDISNFEGILKSKGALGLIGHSFWNRDISHVYSYPASILNDDQQFDIAISYYNSTKNPTMSILKTVATTDLNAPQVARFSSRGPNVVFPDTLKPDITAPGVYILSAFSPASSPDGSLDKRSVSYNILSGTSMACAHVTAASAYVKSLHPDWSPFAIKSALMTTAWPMNATSISLETAEFSYGTGHLDPAKAINPGILYDNSQEEYIKFICGFKLTSLRTNKIFGYNISCTDVVPLDDLNYPTMTAKVKSNGTFMVEFTRRVTNVGIANSTYKARVTSDLLYNITVVPNILSFKMLNEEKSFVVTVTGEVQADMMISASLEWCDGIHIARSPIVVYQFEHWQ